MSRDAERTQWSVDSKWILSIRNERTRENSGSKALNRGVECYLQKCGETPAVPGGALENLMATAECQGSVTSAEIAETLNTEVIPRNGRSKDMRNHRFC